MPDSKLTIWGRANSVNVQKVLWCLAELDLPFARIDAGMQYGKTREADYLAMNPNARIPTLVEGDFVLWESNAIMRYLCLAHGRGTPIYPEAPQRRAAVERWLDWTLSTVQPVDRPVFWGIVRTPPAARDMVQVQKDADAAAEVWAIADRLLAGRPYLEGEAFTLADLALGAYARRWLGVEGITRPPQPHVTRWLADLAQRPGYVSYVAPPMS
jgi:glutathione S-transferase